MKLRIRTTGITFPYKGDSLNYEWIRSSTGTGRWYSHLYDLRFGSWIDYLVHRKVMTRMNSHAQVEGFFYKDIVEQWARLKYFGTPIVILLNIDIAQREAPFWGKIPYSKKAAFSKDAVVLMCKDLTQVKSIVDSVSDSFAEAYGFDGNDLVYWNDDSPRLK